MKRAIIICLSATLSLAGCASTPHVGTNDHATREKIDVTPMPTKPRPTQPIKEDPPLPPPGWFDAQTRAKR